jgi:hypothetical protein
MIIGAVEVTLYLGDKWKFAHIFYSFCLISIQIEIDDVHKNLLYTCWVLSYSAQWKLK